MRKCKLTHPYSNKLKSSSDMRINVLGHMTDQAVASYGQNPYYNVKASTSSSYVYF